MVESILKIEDFNQKENTQFFDSDKEDILYKPYKENDDKNTTDEEFFNDAQDSSNVISLISSPKEVRISTPPILQKAKQRPMKSFITTSKWEGEIIEINEEEEMFTAILKNEETESQNIDNYMDFYFSEVPMDQYKYITKGSLFYWHVGHETTAKRQRINSSLIVFRMLPAWKNKKEEASKNAHFFKSIIDRISR